MAEDPTIPLLNIKASQLPLVLVGPILRRVEEYSVSVFVVLSRKVDKVKLVVMSDLNASGVGTAPLKGETTYVLQMGTYLFATVVTATPFEGGSLEPRSLYHYNLIFEEGGVSKKFADSGVLLPSGETSRKWSDVVAYGTDLFPSFVSPVSDLSHLNIVHGSCRKPHGGNEDALLGLDLMLDYTHHHVEYRPQLLVLTGDQIYGDDVADVISYILQAIMPTLLGYTEVLPDVPDTETLNPGEREAIMRILGGFSCYDGYGKSHSMRMADYIGLYLLAWSDVLWPATLPDYATVGTRTEESVFKKEYKGVEVFKKNISSVRKAMANISMLTMFDDHDVCDDWFLNLRWTKGVLAKKLGKRVIQNALSVFAIFQAWGNTPERFVAGTDGQTVFASIAGLYSEKGANLSTWDSIGSILLPTLQKNSSTDSELVGGFRWDYAIRYEKFMVLALNSRTNRGYYGTSDRSAASLISPAGMTAQINENYPIYEGAELLVLIAGAPVIGWSIVEEWLQLSEMAKVNEEYKAHRGSGETGETSLDYEAWLFSRPAFEDLLTRIVNFDSVIILSGDVHYAFSAEINYWDKRYGSTASLEKRAAFAQFTSSALKNSEFKARVMELATTPGDRAFVGWQDTAYFVAKKGSSNIHMLADPGVLETTDVDLILQEPEWEYTIKFLEDNRYLADRGFPNWYGTLVGWTGPEMHSEAKKALESPTSKNVVAYAQYRQVAMMNGDAKVVGTDNIGQIVFSWSSTVKVATQYLWSNPTMTSGLIIPYTKHSANLQPPAFATKSRPSDSIPRNP